MTRGELLAELRKEGHAVPHHRIEYLVSAGVLQPKKDGSGRYSYTRADVRRIIEAGRQPSARGDSR